MKTAVSLGCLLLALGVFSPEAHAADETYEYVCQNPFGVTQGARILRIVVEKTEGKSAVAKTLSWYLANFDSGTQKHEIEGPFTLKAFETLDGFFPVPGYNVMIENGTRAYIDPKPNKNGRYQDYAEVIFPSAFVTERQWTGWVVETDRTRNADALIKTYSWDCFDENAPRPTL